MNLRKKLTIAAVATIAPMTAGLVGLLGFAGGATSGATPPYVASGSVTCTGVSGGIQFQAPLLLPAPISSGGPVVSKANIAVQVSGCTATDPSVNVTGLNGGAVDGIVTGTIASKSDSATGLAGGDSETLTVNWVGMTGPGGAPLKTTTVKVQGDQPTEGSVGALAGDIGFFIGNDPGVGGYAALETETDIPASAGYSWGAGTQGGITTDDGNAATTANSVDVSVDDLTALEAETDGAIIDDPITDSANCIPAGDYVKSIPASGPYAGDLALAAKATCSASSDALSLTTPFEVTNAPKGAVASAGLPKDTSPATTSGSIVEVDSNYICSASNAPSGNATLYLTADAPTEYPVCAELDAGAPTAAPAIWLIGGAVGADQPTGTAGLAVLDPNAASVGATGSFPTGTGGGATYGDIVSYMNQSELEGATEGASDGYGNAGNANPNGLDYLAIQGSDTGLTF